MMEALNILAGSLVGTQNSREIVDLTVSATPSSTVHSKPSSNGLIKPRKVSDPSYSRLIPTSSDSHPDIHSQSSQSTVRDSGSRVVVPLTASIMQNRPSGSMRNGMADDQAFGQSIRDRSTPKARSKTTTYDSYIKPATSGAFKAHPPKSSSAFNGAPKHPGSYPTNIAEWPSWLTNGRPNFGFTQSTTSSRINPPSGEENVAAETFNLDLARITAEDYIPHQGDADKHMRELLSGAIGDAEGDMGDDAIKEGEDIVEGFAKDVHLMPHQVRGVRWMRGRESGRKYGGILADDMGLGKTVQSLALIVGSAPTSADRKSGYKGGTLVVAPLAVMEQWAGEVRTKTQPGRLKFTTHHGPSRTKSGKTLEEYDVIITTFQTLASELGAHEASSKPDSSDSESPDGKPFGSKTLKKGGKAKQDGHALFDVKWLRVIIDEAQNIKNKNTRAAKAAVALQAKYRWCLTGTPIQNSVEELYSLFHFLRAKPLDDWHVFKERISSLVKDGRTKMAMRRLHVVLKAIMLRRTKDATIDGKPILNLPGRIVKIVQCPFDAEERAFYDALEKKTTLTFNKFLKAGTATANYTSVLTLLLRLRQACDHPSLVTTSLGIDKDAIDDGSVEPKISTPDQADELADMLGGLGVIGGKKCEVCFTVLEDKSEKHCKDCIELARQARQQSAGSVEGAPPASAKIRMLLQLLKDVEERGQRKEKTIVFSQFTSFLNLIEPFLKVTKIAYVRYDGSMRNEKRQEALETIKTSPSIRVILVSFKAGSTGLNLTSCNNVILMDLWWNPALEDQAFDRAHRLGQKLDVNIFKLTIELTVEDRILALQDSKRELAKAALSGDGAKNLMKLTLNDIMNLFKSSAPDVEEEDSDDD